MGKISKLKLQAYQNSGFKAKVAGGNFIAQINPSQITYAYGQTSPPKNKLASGDQFRQPTVEMNPASYSLELLLDRTGAIPALPGETRKPISKQVKQLEKICTGYNGEAHSLNCVEIIYGTFIMHTICKGFNVDFLKFKNNGSPMRAKVKMDFQVFNNPLKANKKKGKKSPDLTRVILAKAGDTLPRLCFNYYGDVKYYPQVAAFNSLSNLTYLAPGQQIIFPPLD